MGLIKDCYRVIALGFLVIEEDFIMSRALRLGSESAAKSVVV